MIYNYHMCIYYINVHIFIRLLLCSLNVKRWNTYLMTLNLMTSKLIWLYAIIYITYNHIKDEL